MTARERGTAQESKRSSFYHGMTWTTLLGLLFIAYNVAVNTGMIRSRASRGVPVQGVENPESLVPTARGVVLGEAEAQITIIEFGDFQCPACEYFSRITKPQLEAAFVATGRARFVYHDLPLTSLHDHAFLAARAARCAEDQGMFWTYHDELYRQQERWAVLLDPVDAFVGYAETLAMDTAAFEACLVSDRHTDVVTGNLELADLLDLNSTPTVLVSIGGETRRATNRDFQTIARTVEEMSR